MFRPLLLAALSLSTAFAADPSPPPATPPPRAVAPSVKKLPDGKLGIGKITFDPKTREIRFPAVVNMTAGALEYLIVLEQGKVHESLLRTSIVPTNLNLAFKLLRYPASPELYPLPTPTGGLSGNYPDVPEEIKKGARIAIDVEWRDAGKTRRVPVNEWVQHAVTMKSMAAGPWVYGGSVVSDGKFAADATGDVASIYLSIAALILYPGEDKENDDVWTPFPKRVPEVDTEVTVIIQPYKKSQPTAKP